MRAADLRGFGPVGTNGPKPEAMAVLDAVGSVLTARIHKLNNKANKAVLSGDEPHPTLLTSQDRAGYLADYYAETRAELAELVRAASGFLPRAVCVTNTNAPDSAEVSLLTTLGELRALRAALSKFGGAA